VLPPSRRASVNVVSSDICDEDRKKRDYARSISRETHRDLDWSRPSRRVIVLRPILMYYAVEKIGLPQISYELLLI
jgi:hypothetical protein